MATVKLVFSFIMALCQILTPVGALVVNFGEGAFFSDWSAADEFTQDSYIELQKNPDEDFIILNLADVQLEDDEVYDTEGVETAKLIDKIVEEQAPDLITLSGDNAWDTMAYIEIIRQVDSYGIPWAPVMGNHDGQGLISEFWAAYLLSEAENCLFEFGPKDMGYGNYIINITENGKIIHTLVMLDTHNSNDYELADGTVISGYDHLWDNQIEWYKWAINGTKKLAGETVESTVIMHIPVYEYREAWEMAYGSEEYGTISADKAPEAQGVNREGIWSPPVNNGFFDVCKELGSTKNMIAGHDHINNFQVYYEGIRLNYALKTGYGCYWDADLLGGTTITIDSDGSAYVEHQYVQSVL